MLHQFASVQYCQLIMAHPINMLAKGERSKCWMTPIGKLECWAYQLVVIYPAK